MSDRKWTEEDTRIVKSILMPWATDTELRYFLRVCATYGLDPFRREVVLVRRRRRLPDGREEVSPVCITTRDGYLRIAQRDQGFLGVYSAPVYENDEFYIEFKLGPDARGGEVILLKHRFTAKDRGKLLGAWAVALHKDRPAYGAYLSLDQYFDQESSTWRRFPAAMITKVAEVHVLRRQFSSVLGGLVTAEEVGSDIAVEEPDRTDEEHADHVATGAPAKGVPARPVLPGPTEFWTAVRGAAQSEGCSPVEWVRARTGGEVDIRKLDPDTLLALYREARERPKAAQPAGFRDDGKKRLLRELERSWKAQRLKLPEQAEQVRSVSGGRTNLPTELTGEGLLALLEPAKGADVHAGTAGA